MGQLEAWKPNMVIYTNMIIMNVKKGFQKIRVAGGLCSRERMKQRELPEATEDHTQRQHIWVIPSEQHSSVLFLDLGLLNMLGFDSDQDYTATDSWMNKRINIIL